MDHLKDNGEEKRSLCDILKEACTEINRNAIAIEKGFQHGGDKLREAGMPIKSLAIIDKADENGFVFREDD